eukprot:4529535-Amphidinium_carterae.1
MSLPDMDGLNGCLPALSRTTCFTCLGPMHIECSAMRPCQVIKPNIATIPSVPGCVPWQVVPFLALEVQSQANLVHVLPAIHVQSAHATFCIGLLCMP